jgi:hypothetical protein
MQRAGSICLAVAIAACGDPTSTRNHSSAPPAPVRDAAPAPGQIEVATAPETGRAAGAPHAGPISRIVLAVDGPAALTLDQSGGVRLWPDLSRAAAPLIVPARHATGLSAGGVGDALTVAYLDASGAGRVARLTDRGTWQELWAAPPSPGLRQLEVMPGGRELAALTAEGTVVLMSDRGRPLARYDERGFDPTRIWLAEDGSRLLAARQESRDDGSSDLLVQPLAIDRSGATPTLAAAAAETRIEKVVTPIAVSADVGAVGYLTRAADNSHLRPVLFELATGAATALPPEQLSTAPIGLGFIGRRALLVQPPIGPSWRVDATAARPFDGPPVLGSAPTATRPDLAVAGVGRWLAVVRPSKRSQHYLGHAAFQPLTGAVSPSGDRIAWLIPGGQVYVTRPRTGTVVRLSPAGATAYRLAFASDDLLVVFDSQGGIRVVDPTTGELRDQAYAGGAPRTFDVAPITADAAGMIALNPSNQAPRLFEIDGRGTLRGPYLVAHTASAAGLLTGDDGPGMWTHDGSRLRRFTLAELRAGLTARDVADRGVDRPATPAWLGDRSGHLYHWNAQRQQVIITGAAPGEIALPAGVQVYRIVPAPDGDLIALQLSTRVIAVYDADGDERWTRAHPTALNDLAWSPDGSQLIVAGSSGGAIYRGSDGEPVELTCGIWFEKRASPPHDAHLATNEKLVCEP